MTNTEDNYFISKFISEPLGNQLSSNYIRRNKGHLNWKDISSNYSLPYEFIREFQDKLDWDFVCKCQKLSEEFIAEFQDKVNWTIVCRYQKLSEQFLIEFKDKVNWLTTACTQTLSEEFVRKNIDILDIERICMYQEISEQFIEDFSDKINFSSACFLKNKQIFTYSEAMQNRILMGIIDFMQRNTVGLKVKTPEQVNENIHFTPYMKQQYAKLHSFI
jgi:hypothetical protein